MMNTETHDHDPAIRAGLALARLSSRENEINATLAIAEDALRKVAATVRKNAPGAVSDALHLDAMADRCLDLDAREMPLEVGQ